MKADHKLMKLIGAMGSLFSSTFLDRMPLYSQRTPRRPPGKALRNPADPHQAARIQAAADKRARKAAKLERDAGLSYLKNYAWPAEIGFDPFYVKR